MAHHFAHALENHRLAFIAPTRREMFAARCLAAGGARVTCWLPAESPAGGVAVAVSLSAAVEGASLAIAPLHVPGDGAPRLGEGAPLDPGDLALLGRIPLVAGRVPPSWREHLGERAVVVDIMPRDDFALLNSVPTAEGALVEAMAMTGRTIAWERSLVLGFGRVGIVLAGRLAALEGRVTVVARSPRDLAAAEALGHDAAHMSELAEAASGALYVFNTVPAPVLTGRVLGRAGQGTVVIDLASAPGGTDFEAARQLGIDARLCTALPGRVAPDTAGEIVARVVAAIWRELSEAQEDLRQRR